MSVMMTTVCMMSAVRKNSFFIISSCVVWLIIDNQ